MEGRFRRRVVRGGTVLRLALLPAMVGMGTLQPVSAKTLLSIDEALALAFPSPAKVATKTVLLSREEAERAASLAHEPVKRKLIVRYEARIGTRLIGVGYVDSRIVRTLPTSIFFVVSGDPPIVERVEILAWNEPPDYYPMKRFTDQLAGRELGPDLSLKKAIHPVTGATLTSRALTDAARRILAIHTVIEERKDD